MKKITLFGLVILLSLLSISLMGQVPQKINYQAVARNAAGTPIANKQIAVKFTIRTGSSSGSEVFSERHTPWTNSLGTFNAIIGYGNPIYGSFGAINWGTGTKWLQIGVDEHGGTNYVDMGTFEMLSVPYARLAQDVVNINDADADPTNELQTLSISGTQLTISQGNTVTLPSSGGGDNWGTQVVQTDATLAGEGTTANKLKIAQQGALNGQVLKWNGSTWAPANDNTGSGGGTPGGNYGSVQYNNSGAFGGSDNFTYDAGDIYLGYPNSWTSMNIDGGSSPDYAIPARIDLNKRWSIYDVGTDKHLKIGPDPGNSSNNSATPFVINHNSGRVDIGEISTSTDWYTGSKLRVDGGTQRGIMAGTNSSTHAAAVFRNTNSGGVALELENNSNSKAALVIQNKYDGNSPAIRINKANGNKFFEVEARSNSSVVAGTLRMIGTNQYFALRTDMVNSNQGLYIYAGKDSGTGAGLFFGNFSGTFGYLEPASDEGAILGESARRFTAVWATNGTIQTSDERDKSAIQDLNYGLQSVLKLRPISYQWKNEGVRLGTGRNLGFSAQELQQIIPDAVVAEKGKTPEDADHTYYGVKYAEIIPVLVKAIQELEQIVRDQQEQINRLSNR
ncbi:MAG: tail fiber domain-containing protein [Lentimicrobiaceae bacterium]|nr:tail fiber domain-containing protein [Lentimicrobiaceae bacterium]